MNENELELIKQQNRSRGIKNRVIMIMLIPLITLAVGSVLLNNNRSKVTYEVVFKYHDHEKILKVDEGTKIKQILKNNDTNINSNELIYLNYKIISYDDFIDMRIKSNIVFVIDLVTTKKINETEVVMYDKVEEETDDLSKGENKVKTPGVNGEVVITYKITYLNGIEKDKKKISSKITKQAIDEVVLVGTKVTATPSPNNTNNGSSSGNTVISGGETGTVNPPVVTPPTSPPVVNPPSKCYIEINGVKTEISCRN